MRNKMKYIKYSVIFAFIITLLVIPLNLNYDSFAWEAGNVEQDGQVQGGGGKGHDISGGGLGYFILEYGLVGSVKYKGEEVTINKQLWKKDYVPVTGDSGYWERINSGASDWKVTDAVPDAIKYDLFAQQGESQTLYNKLSQDTFDIVGATPEEWADGTVSAGDAGLYAVGNLVATLYDHGYLATLGFATSNEVADSNYTFTNTIKGAINVSYVYGSSGPGDHPDYTYAKSYADAGCQLYNGLKKCVAGNSQLKNMLSRRTKQSLTDLLKEGGKIEFYDQTTKNSTEYTLIKTITKTGGLKNGTNLSTEGITPATSSKRTFKGWYNDKNGKGTQFGGANNWLIKDAPDGTKLYAYYEVEVTPYVCTTAANVSSSTYTAKDKVIKPYGTVITLPAASNPTPFTFEDWYTDKMGKGVKFDSKPIYEHSKAYANYLDGNGLKINYYAKSNYYSDSYVKIKTLSAPYNTVLGEKYNLSIAPLKDATPNGWYRGPNGTNGAIAFSTLKITSDLNVYAKYTQTVIVEPYITWNYASCNWTNDPYTIVATLHVPDGVRRDAFLYMQWCNCHSHCDDHTHGYCSAWWNYNRSRGGTVYSCSDGHDGGLNCSSKHHTSFCYGYVKVCTKEVHASHTDSCYSTTTTGNTKTLTCTKEIHTHTSIYGSCYQYKLTCGISQHPHTGWSSKYSPGCHSTSYCRSHSVSYASCCSSTTCYGCATWDAADPCSNTVIGTPKGLECDFPWCSTILYCRSYAHTNELCTGCQRNTSIKWNFDGSNHQETSKVGTCGGASISYSYHKINFTVNQTGTWNAKAYFKIKALVTEKKKEEIAVNKTGQSWQYPESDNRRYIEIEDEKGTYKFDNVKPVINLSVTESNGNNYASGVWTKNSVTVKVSATDEHSGFGKGHIIAKGRYLAGTNNYTDYYEQKTLASGQTSSITFDKSGEYTVTVYVEDKANQGYSALGENGIPNQITKTYNIKIDKIPPILKYGYNNTQVVYNGMQKRYDSSAQTNPSFYMHASDKESDYASSGLKSARYLITQSPVDGNSIKNSGTEFATSNQAYGTYTSQAVPSEHLKNGKYTYLILYAIDNVGNEAYTIVSSKATNNDFKNESINGTVGYVGPKNHLEIAEFTPRLIPTTNIFINRAVLSNTLEITRAYDIKWENAITLNNTAKTANFAVYRNAGNDMIGLGYRVNFRYKLIGYGVDTNDSSKLYFNVYGLKGNQYTKLDIYLPNNSGVYEKAPANSIYYTRDLQSASRMNNFNEKTENAMSLNSSIFASAGTDETYLYFNYIIPANAKFKYQGTDTEFTGAEVLITADILSHKYMDHNGYIEYRLSQDNDIVWNTSGLKKQFYGTSNTVTNGVTTRGQAFWYDAVYTALKDLEGSKNN